MQTNNTKRLFLTIFFVLSSLFIARYMIIGQAVYGDGIYYYAFTRSLVKDFDINFENEFEHRYSPKANNTLMEIDPGEIQPDTRTGHVSSKYPVGPGVFWLPAFMFADIIANTINILDNNFPNNGFSNIYQLSVGVFNVAVASLGLFFLYKTLLIFVNKTASIITTIAAGFGSNLFYYSALDVINSHPISFFLGAIYFYVMFGINHAKKYPILGLIASALALTRTQDAIFVLFIAIFILIQRTSSMNKLRDICASLSVFIVVFALQLVSWKIIYGSYLAITLYFRRRGF